MNLNQGPKHDSITFIVTKKAAMRQAGSEESWRHGDLSGWMKMISNAW